MYTYSESELNKYAERARESLKVLEPSIWTFLTLAFASAIAIISLSFTFNSTSNLILLMVAGILLGNGFSLVSLNIRNALKNARTAHFFGHLAYEYDRPEFYRAVLHTSLSRASADSLVFAMLCVPIYGCLIAAYPSIATKSLDLLNITFIILSLIGLGRIWLARAIINKQLDVASLQNGLVVKRDEPF